MSDPRQAPLVAREGGKRRRVRACSPGVVGASVESELGFRPACQQGKIVERNVDDGEQVEAGQPLMRIEQPTFRP